MTTLITRYRGRVVDSAADSVLAEFSSVVSAGQCSVRIQRELTARNAELPSGRRMEVRIGVNLGDVLIEGDRIYGDGINVAARARASPRATVFVSPGRYVTRSSSKLTLSTAQLVGAGAGRHLWAERYDRDTSSPCARSAGMALVVAVTVIVGVAWIAVVILVIIATGAGYGLVALNRRWTRPKNPATRSSRV